MIPAAMTARVRTWRCEVCGWLSADMLNESDHLPSLTAHSATHGVGVRFVVATYATIGGEAEPWTVAR